MDGVGWRNRAFLKPGGDAGLGVEEGQGYVCGGGRVDGWEKERKGRVQEKALQKEGKGSRKTLRDRIRVIGDVSKVLTDFSAVPSRSQADRRQCVGWSKCGSRAGLVNPKTGSGLVA